MRQLDREVVNLELDVLLETLAAEGPIAVQENGEDVAVLISPEEYAHLSGPAQRGFDSAARGDEKDKAP